MADSTPLSEEALRSVAEKIGARIFELRRRAEAGGQSGGISPYVFSEFEMWETLEIWMLKAGVPDLTQTDEDLTMLVRPSYTWHHQLKAGPAGGEKKAVAFAQSLVATANDQSLRDLFFSDELAAKLDRAITLADQWFPKNGVVRLLSLPEYRVDALWCLSAVAGAGPPRLVSQVIVVSAPPDFQAGSGQPGTPLMSSADFVRALARTTKGMGLRI